MTPERLKHLEKHAIVVEDDALRHLAQTFPAAKEVLEMIDGSEHPTMRPMVLFDTKDETLLLMWVRKDDQGDVQEV